MTTGRVRAIGSLGLLALSACTGPIGQHASQHVVPSATQAAYPIDSDDARFAECSGPHFSEDVIAAFALVAADYQDHFPQMGLAPELDVERPAFAVVFAEDWPGVPRVSPADPGTNNVCIYLGTPPDGELNFYGSVDTSGLRVDGPGPS